MRKNVLYSVFLVVFFCAQICVDRVEGIVSFLFEPPKGGMEDKKYGIYKFYSIGAGRSGEKDW